MGPLEAVANIGQAMFMARRALEALRAQLPSVAALVEADLVGEDKPIKTFDVPAEPDAAWHEKHKAPLLVGQLKAIAEPFYNRLHDAVPQWLQTEREANNTQFPGSHFPWRNSTGEVNNHAMATIGQLKAVFALHFELDSDSDSVSNLQEWYRNGSLNSAILPAKLMAYLSARDLTYDPQGDYDGDGMSNQFEVLNGLDPLDHSDAAMDADGDNVSNLRECQLGTSPTGIYRIEVLPTGEYPYFHSVADDGSVVVQDTNSHLALVPAPDNNGTRTLVDPAPTDTWDDLETITANLVADNTLGVGVILTPSGPVSSDGTFRVFFCRHGVVDSPGTRGVGWYACIGRLMAGDQQPWGGSRRQ